MFELLEALKVDSSDSCLDLMLNGHFQLLVQDFGDAIGYLLLAILKYAKLSEYVEHDIILGNNKISESIEGHIKDMYLYIEELYRRQIDKSIRRHYKNRYRQLQ